MPCPPNILKDDYVNLMMYAQRTCHVRPTVTLQKSYKFKIFKKTYIVTPGSESASLLGAATQSSVVMGLGPWERKDLAYFECEY